MPRLLHQNYASIHFTPVYRKLPKIVIITKLNIFKQINISEPDHSKILSNLLDPKGTHGHKDLFLKIFFQVFIPKMEIDKNKKWIVSTEKDRYDIRIKTQDNSKIIIIENKSNNAKDGTNQLYRYWFDGIYIPQFNRNLNGLECFSKIIYLSPSDYKQPEEQSISRPDYIKDKNMPEKVPLEILQIAFFNVQIIKWLDLCIEKIDNNSDVYYYLNQYRDFWR